VIIQPAFANDRANARHGRWMPRETSRARQLPVARRQRSQGPHQILVSFALIERRNTEHREPRFTGASRQRRWTCARLDYDDSRWRHLVACEKRNRGAAGHNDKRDD
jgi:hypothetical protein